MESVVIIMLIIEQMLANGDSIAFSTLFIGLLLWVISSNDKRETKYQETITKLADSLNDFADLKVAITDIKDKVDKWGTDK